MRNYSTAGGSVKGAAHRLTAANALDTHPPLPRLSVATPLKDNNY